MSMFDFDDLDELQGYAPEPELAMSMFDFDDLDELQGYAPEPERIKQKHYMSLQESAFSSDEKLSVDKDEDLTADGGSSELSDGLSEVWPGEDLCVDLEELPDETRQLDAVAEVATWWDEPGEGNQNEGGQASNDGEDAFEVWEVVFGPRIVVRLQPRLDAAVGGIGSKQELFFVDPHGSDSEWVKLSVEKGYILKDGRVKDPNLGMLLVPFSFDDIPERERLTVSESLRSAWIQARVRNGAMFLRPPAIAKLRKGYEEAVRAACKGSEFDLEVFEASFQATQDTLAAAQALAAGPQAPPTAAPTAASSSPKKAAATASSPEASGRSPAGRSLSRRDSLISRKSSPACLADYDFEVTPAFASALASDMEKRLLPSQEDVRHIVLQASKIFQEQSNLVQLTVPPKATLHVVGDLHGQFWDLLHILETSGSPSKDEWYLFNGDFVDRGQFSVEVVILLFAWKVALPKYVHLNRGNHESLRMNLIYGFMTEVRQKYSVDIFSLFTTAFKNLPLATLVNESVLIVHGGLARKENMRLQEIQRFDRKREPDEWAEDLMVDLLWSDPSTMDGQNASPRGAGILFGADVTRNFCNVNGLTCVIRSHEMKYEGYEWCHDDRCLTIFSAANYCGMCGNFGAVCNITPRFGEPKIALADMNCKRFEASPYPNEERPSGGFQMPQVQPF